MGGSDSYANSPSLCASTPASLPGSTVLVTLGDMGMTQMMGGDAPMGVQMRLSASPGAVARGPVSFVVRNQGWRTHELVILPLTTDAAGQRTVGADGKVIETGSLGEVSANCAAGAGDGIPAGSTSWVTVTLPAGHYELVCNIVNHYADGMHQGLTVT